MKKLFITTYLFLLFSSNVIAENLSTSSLSGKWTFTHMNLDDTDDRPVNRAIEFLNDGTVINYDASGNKKSNASYTIQGNTIVYQDKQGKQKWLVEKFDKTNLQVDNRGAMMFFERQ